MMRFIGNYVNISQIKVCLHYFTSWIVYVGVSQTSYCKIGRISVSLEVGKLSDQKVSCLLWCLSGHMSRVTFQIICTRDNLLYIYNTVISLDSCVRLNFFWPYINS